MFEKEKKADLLTAELERKILIGEYALDENLPVENDLCSQYGVSRTTVREAVSNLISRGLVERKHGIGAIVINETVAAGSRALELAVRSKSIPIEDILSVRKILEIESVAWAARHADQVSLDTLLHELSIMEDPKTPLKDYIEADYRFHLSLAEATGNTALLVMFEAISKPFREFITSTVRDDLRPETMNAYHRKIFEAVKKKDEKAARRSMREHMDAAAELIGIPDSTAFRSGTV